MNPILQLTDVTREFGGNPVLADIHLTVNAGERLAVLGPSGSGKTTLLRLIAGLEAPTRGEIFINGKPASRAGQILIPPEHRQVALVFQGLALFPHLRALEQIAFAARGRGGIASAKVLLERIGLGHRANARLDELSGGERQRIALARALAQKPGLLLMDEPFASLDDEKRGEMRDLLRSLLGECDTSLILVTHSRDDALNLAKSALVLQNGRSMVCDSLESILMTPRCAAAVRSLGLGQIIRGQLNPAGEVETALGIIQIKSHAPLGPIELLVRPGQPRLAERGVEGEVVSMELRPPEMHEIRRIAVVRVGSTDLRVFVGEVNLSVGDHVQVRIHGECEVVSDTLRSA